MRHLVAALLWLFSPALLAAPLGLAPGSTDLGRAEALLGKAAETPIAGARYRFTPPAGSGFSKVELYMGRESGVLEVAELSYETPQDPTPLRAALGQKIPDISYVQAAGGSCEVYLGPRASLQLGCSSTGISPEQHSPEQRYCAAVYACT